MSHKYIKFGQNINRFYFLWMGDPYSLFIIAIYIHIYLIRSYSFSDIRPLNTNSFRRPCYIYLPAIQYRFLSIVYVVYVPIYILKN